MIGLLIEFDEKTSELKAIVDEIKTYIGEIAVSKQVREAFTYFYKNIEKYSKATQDENYESLSNAASDLAVFGEALGVGITQLQDADEQMKNMGLQLREKSSQYRAALQKSSFGYKPLTSSVEISPNVSINSYKSVQKNLKKIAEDHLDHDLRIKKLLNESDARAGDISNRIEKIDGDLKKEFAKIDSLYQDTLTDLNAKNEQLNDVLGHISGRVIAGDYEANAEEEKKMADWLRIASLFCMTAIVLIVSYSFWETTTADFQWQNSVFRTILAVMLSVPAAYLATESAKHREQQYSHLQTSLDLKAITPYIASLPPEEQNKIKAEIANRLFATKGFSRNKINTTPINSHEVIMEFIKKLDASK